jgi:hypothetical protein
MIPENLIFPAIAIFVVMVIGLAFTVLEFVEIQKKSKAKKKIA